MIDWLDGVTVVPVLRRSSMRECLDEAMLLIQQGHRVIEVTLTTPGALDVIDAVATSGAVAGAGTVLDADQLRSAVSAGASFCVAPVCDSDLVGAAKADVILAGATPTELLTAHRAGSALVKVFPAAQLGGPAFVRAVLTTMPFLRLFPTGGVRVEDIDDYLSAGATVVGIGSALAGHGVSGLTGGAQAGRRPV